MKTWLDYDNNWTIYLEPENRIEECAFEYLAGRPKNQVKILITRLGLFSRGEENVRNGITK